MNSPLYHIQGCFTRSTERTVLLPPTRDGNFASFTKWLDEIVRTGWEKQPVREAWLYEDGELVAYVHEGAFVRDQEVVADGNGDAIHTIKRVQRAPRKQHRRLDRA